MTPTEVLKMLKGKIDAAGVNKCNYAIETSDIEAINQALLLYDVVGQSEQLVCEHKYQDNVCDWRGVRKCIICGQMEKAN